MQNRLKQLRKYFGLSQAQFANKIERTPSLIASMESGRCNGSQATIHKICFVFGINEAWLVSGTGEMFAEGREVGGTNKENVGARVRHVRKQAGMTQIQFCLAIGYSKMQVSFVELGRATPSNAFLQKVASTFNVSYDWLLTGQGKAEAEEANLDDALIEWLKRNPEVVKELRVRSGLE